jgi:hypothetical protein
MKTPSIISTRQVLHRADATGPRITEVQTIQTEFGVVEVDLWTQDGRVVRVGEPRPVSAA